jgi:hypothetical protein
MSLHIVVNKKVFPLQFYVVNWTIQSRNPTGRLLNFPFRPYTWNNTERINICWRNLILENFYEKLSNHVNFHLYRTILTTTLHNTNIFWVHLNVTANDISLGNRHYVITRIPHPRKGHWPHTTLMSLAPFANIKSQVLAKSSRIVVLRVQFITCFRYLIKFSCAPCKCH